ncbi:MAG: 30S ribosomal protein S17 [Candidatus Jacksonbacteria bacterium]|jgi:small subunit ribosomal protein S17|nr:30S ribosomal protein S17 [Candidatus Jacksonbacteria bacterium]MBT6034078.1 30S ribosomal protein S17 [Candidatus Jacksonbacteria bacterium]MBT6301113.1 30S ribosomal protein S17 [Candidatus Jacksonbacteria bacterium]MBT6757304.1 30S ribosomal protein S17 [Candidatus Jacksonbacteria bacterium]MBT6955615.1 30S ribosomal protein S17 [Candidatus Jacksonbacteria bacterium]
MEEKTIKKARTLTGTVVSTAMEKTVVVRIDRTRMHKLYKKRMTVSTRYQAHDEKGEYVVGDAVTVQECRPYSKNKKWRVIAKVTQ